MRCPQAVQLDVLRPCEPLPTSPFFTMLRKDGRDFEADVFELLRDAIPDAVIVWRDLPPTAREAATLSALERGVALVIGGRLPVDPLGLRVGEPDLLLRADAFSPGAADAGYLPLDVKHHKTLEAKSKDHAEGAITSELESLLAGPAGPDAELQAKWRWPDLLQLAHYQRLLEACGHASVLGRWAAIVGREERVVWYDLDLLQWRPSEWIDEPSQDALSTMEVYDLEFAHRLSVIDAALIHESDPTAPLLAEPIAVSDCDTCEWQERCFAEMEASGEISVLPGMTIAKRRKYHARGVTTLEQLAALDSPTARLVAAGVDLEHLEEKARRADPSTPLTDLLAGRPKQADLLMEADMVTVADIGRLDPLTATFSGCGMSDFPQQIDNARALTSSHPAHRRRGIDQVIVPRGATEVDVDMESNNDGCYLWGALLTVRDGSGGVVSEYNPFASWDPDIAAGEIEAFLGFWDWFTELRDEASRNGRSFRAYCYSQGAENGQLRRIAARCGREDEVEDFIRSEQWVDLLPLVKEQLITGLPGNGLKTIAPLAGFSWRGEDVGGNLAMVRYLEAISDEDADVRAKARRWILNYNEDDVRATAHLREWLDQFASLLPSIVAHE